MAVFCFKKILSSTPRIGELFKASREEKKYSLADVSGTTRIPEKYLVCLEQGSFAALPRARAHRLAYVRAYAEFLELSSEACSDQFAREEGLQNADMIHPLTQMKYFPFSSVGIFLRNSVAACLILIFAGYLSWQIKGVLEPPSLTIYSPVEGAVVTKPSTLVEGVTEAESKLAVNGQEVIMNSDGKFQAELNLMTGLNTITITATKKKHGKTTTITRHVIVRAGVVSTDKKVPGKLLSQEKLSY